MYNVGVQVIAPSDMMDGRIGAIKKILWENGFGSTVSVLSYHFNVSSCECCLFSCLMLVAS